MGNMLSFLSVPQPMAVWGKWLLESLMFLIFQVMPFMSLPLYSTVVECLYSSSLADMPVQIMTLFIVIHSLPQGLFHVITKIDYIL